MADSVTSLQEALMLCGYYPGEVDGMMGGATKRATKKFQEDNDLDADGIAGAATKAQLAVKLGEAATKAAGLQGYYEGGATSADDDL